MLINSLLVSTNNIGAILLTIDFLLMATLFLYRKKTDPKVARNIYLWVNIITASILMWSTTSPHYAFVLPVFILIASLIVSHKQFLAISSFCVLNLVSFGVITISNGQIASLNFGYWQLIDLTIMLCSAIYTAWQTSFDMRYTLKSLNLEIQKVTESHSQIESLINFDPLTGLANKTCCEERYVRFLDDAKYKNEVVAVLFLDLDNFKTVNDFYNHSVGDKLLVHVSQQINGLVKERDIVSRLSGDEFILMLSRPENYNFQQLASRILKRLEKPVNIDAHLIDITASIGVAIAQEADYNFNEIRKRADIAMYKAKQSGKNNVCIYDEEMYQQSLHKISIVNGLKEALRQDGLEVYLQPKVDIATGKMNSAEALIRWTGNNKDNISPAEFIPLIESTELICNISEWVIHHACRLCKEWHNKGYQEMSISVNISSSQFMRGGLLDIVKKELKSSHLDPQYLELELTEHAVFHDNDHVLNELKQLKKLGVTLSIDDFGTGYSNIEYLTKFNVDLVKIDQSFIRDLQHSTDNYAIVTAIIKMANTLGLRVVAEGVETNKEWDILKELGCNYGQGFLWSKALSPTHFTAYLEQDLRLTA
ncbi:MAG: EAL domain-containing protein [Cocleimonas sp.]